MTLYLQGVVAGIDGVSKILSDFVPAGGGGVKMLVCRKSLYVCLVT
nr:MAG TPA: hypothetical protein [Caudoviricetes sp.]